MTVSEANQYCSVLEDLEWLRDEWWEGQPDHLTDGHIRRGSATLHLLLVEDRWGQAWRHYGFQREPSLRGPDLAAFLRQASIRLEEVIALVSGGGRQNGVEMAFIGAVRVDNPSTGAKALDAVGFAVQSLAVTRLPTSEPPNVTNEVVDRLWTLSAYRQSLAAVSNGKSISRLDVVRYFRNQVGGAHLNAVGERHGVPRGEQYAAELAGRVTADIREGLVFELLCIGQAIGRSADASTLIEAMRRTLRTVE